MTSQKTIINALFQKAKQASRNAYAPYSKLQVGAIVITEKGNAYSGCNMENASFGLTTCAERNAIAAAVNAEGKKMKIKFIAVTNAKGLAISPCGVCRQVIAEFSNKETTEVIFRSAEGVVSKKIHELLPDAFSM